MSDNMTWKLVATGNGIHSGTQCVATTHMEPQERRVAHARRIVACWNACASYSTENLEEFGRWISSGEVPAVLEIEQKLAAVEQQRDELLTALEGVLPFLTGEYWPGTVSDAAVDFAVATARKVAANVKDKT